MSGDEDEDDVDDIEQEFKMEEEKYKLKQEEMLQGKMKHGDDDENAKPLLVGSAKANLCLIEGNKILQAFNYAVNLIHSFNPFYNIIYYLYVTCR